MAIDDTIIKLRKEYLLEALDERQVERSPFDQFRRWFEEALKSDLLEPNAMALGTTSQNGQPAVRMVLLKSYGLNGFTFFTNYLSRKGEELAINNKASLLFYWAELERQIRIEGSIEKTSSEISDEYFSKRPKGSQLGALVSNQSRIVSSRQQLEDRLEVLNLEFKDKPLPRPENWGGYCLTPSYFEFWQGRENRLHDRIVYVEQSRGKWKIQRLAP